MSKKKPIKNVKRNKFLTPGLIITAIALLAASYFIFTHFNNLRCTVTFINGGGTETEALLVKKGETPEEPEAPNKDSYLFSGWYTDKDCTVKYGFNEAVSGSMSLYAKWVPASEAIVYTVSGGQAAITGYKEGLPPYLYIPSEIGGYAVTSIGQGAFKNCTALKEIYIYGNSIYIWQDVFTGCSSLEKMTVPLAENGSMLPNWALNYYFNSNSENVPASLKTVNLTKNVSGIHEEAFYGCKYITKIGLPDSVIQIGRSAFCNCESLTDIIIPASVSLIGTNAFGGCYSLKKLTVPEGVTAVLASTFIGCTNLKEINLPQSLLRIDDNAFSNCALLENISLPSRLEVIGQSAFSFCNNLKKIGLPSSIKEIKTAAFFNCKSLESAAVSEGLEKIGDSAFYGCEELISINLPSTLTYIGPCAFYGCTDLNNIIIPSRITEIIHSGIIEIIHLGITEIYNSTFYICSNLVNLTLNEGLTKIGASAFSGCRLLSVITIPSTVTVIESGAFENCKADTVTFKGATPPSMDIVMFGYVYSYIRIYVPQGSLQAYKDAYDEFKDKIYAIE